MGRENGLLFAAQQVRRFYRDFSQHLILGVNDPPLARDFAGFGRKRFHWEKEHGNYERRNSMSTRRHADETDVSNATDEAIAEMLAGQLAFARLILWPCRIRLPQRLQSHRAGTKIFRNGISRSSARRNWPSRPTCAVAWSFALGVTGFGKTCSVSSTRCFARLAIATPTSRCSFR